MSERGASAAKTLAKFEALGFTHVVMIPDSESRILHETVGRSKSIKLITPCREGESMAIAAGLWVGGQKPLVVVQCTGLFEAGDSLRGCGLGPKVPLRLMVGWRGYAGAIANKKPIDSAYTYAEPVLSAYGIPHWHLMRDEDLPLLDTMDKTAEETSFPAAVVTGFTFRP